MGYTTDFAGEFKTDRPLDEETYTLLKGIAETRRMKRDVGPEYGIEGEYYIEGSDDHLEQDANIIDYNEPPRTQPGLWCQWFILEDKQTIVAEGEKFYDYIEWLEYLINNILEPRGYKLNGKVKWQGEDMDDRGKIIAVNNKLTINELE